MFGTNDIQLARVHLNVEHAIHLHGFAIDMNSIGMGHDDAQVARTEGHHIGVLIEFARKQLDRHLGDVHEWSPSDQGDVEESVGHGGMGRDVGIVAPLRGVANGNEESLLLDAPVVGVDDVSGRFVVGHEFAETTEVSERTSRTSLGKLG